jgi:hypothetical protein
LLLHATSMYVATPIFPGYYLIEYLIKQNNTNHYAQI